MTVQDYNRMSRYFRTPARQRLLNVLNTLLTYSCYGAYPLCLVVLFWQKDSRLLRCILVPAVSFVAVSVFRRICNAKRPYEVLDIQPLIHKDTKGQSFPSRHVFSCFVIAMTFLWLSKPLGSLFLMIGVLLAACRVIGGVHWTRDVVCGAVIGVLSGVIGFYLM